MTQLLPRPIVLQDVGAFFPDHSGLRFPTCREKAARRDRSKRQYSPARCATPHSLRFCGDATHLAKNPAVADFGKSQSSRTRAQGLLLPSELTPRTASFLSLPAAVIPVVRFSGNGSMPAGTEKTSPMRRLQSLALPTFRDASTPAMMTDSTMQTRRPL